MLVDFVYKNKLINSKEMEYWYKMKPNDNVKDQRDNKSYKIERIINDNNEKCIIYLR